MSATAVAEAEAPPPAAPEVTDADRSAAAIAHWAPLLGLAVHVAVVALGGPGILHLAFLNLVIAGVYRYASPARESDFFVFHANQSIYFNILLSIAGLCGWGLIGFWGYVGGPSWRTVVTVVAVILAVASWGQVIRVGVLALRGERYRNPAAFWVSVAMWTFVARRLLALIPLLVVVSFLTYCLQRVSPGDYYTRQEQNPAYSKELIQDLRAKAGLDRGIVGGYFHWATSAVQGDFGRSLEVDKPVFELIADRMLNTLRLSLSALMVAWVVAIPLGVIAAVRPNSIVDKGSGIVAYFGLSIPSVFFALLAVMFAAKTGIFPIGGMRDLVHWDDMSGGEKVADSLWHLILPVFVLSTIAMATWMRQMRGSMVETLGQDYIRTARAKGLSRPVVLFKHALRNAINPLVTLFGYSIAYILNGSFLVEIVMAWPGLARLVVTALFSKDQPLVMAAVLMATIMLVIGNMIADILLAMVDPRIRLS